MEKILDLSEIAIAVILMVVAVSVQVYDNHYINQLVEDQSAPEQVSLSEKGELRYLCNGLDLIGHLILLGEKGQNQVVYRNKEYPYDDFIEEVLQVSVIPENRSFSLGAGQADKLKSQVFELYQAGGKWRIRP